MEYRSNRRDGLPLFARSRRVPLVALLVLAALVLLTACGGGTSEGSVEAESSEETSGGASTGETTEEVALTPSEATISEKEDTAMPASGREEDPAQALPENPPEGVETFPATTNGNVQGSITYDQDPPTNGDHAPYWLNCGFYSSSVENEAAVHSMDHGAVWITYRPDLPEDQVNTLRDLAREDYVLVSPYQGLRAPVISTAWRNQLELEGADDPRLRQFVDQFRVSETAPRSGNGCDNGRGQPES
ncbi:MAG: DUF3105 domain-containing protein [Actinomycetota bacterium]|nr:DUF3105 domain-containing protein [Actinomycetota bacterium]